MTRYFNIPEYDDVLQHYGVIGMQWGVTKDKEYKKGIAKLKSDTRKALKKSDTKNEKTKIKSKYNENVLDLKTKVANRLYPNNSSEVNRQIQNLKKLKLGESYYKAKYLQTYYNDKDHLKHPIKSSIKATTVATGHSMLNTTTFGLHGFAEGQKNKNMRSGQTKLNKTIGKVKYYSIAGGSAAIVGLKIAKKALKIYSAYKAVTLASNKEAVANAYATGNVFDAEITERG